MFGTDAEFASLDTTDQYVPATDNNDVFYLEMYFDSTRGIDVPDTSHWNSDAVAYASLFAGQRPT
jgi:hypothetical protein